MQANRISSCFKSFDPFVIFHSILRIPVFRLALNDFFSKGIVYIYNVFSQRTIRPIIFDAKRAELSLQRFLTLGAQQHYATPRDGQGSIHMITMSARDLENKITTLGGRWEKAHINNKTVLAIVPPQQISTDWTQLETLFTKHLHWKQEGGVIITSEEGDLIEDADYFQKCFLYTHDTSTSFTSDWKRAGFYLGAKQDFCYFNNGNIWKSTGRPSPSEQSFYLDIEAVHAKIAHKYTPHQLWVGGKCGGAPVAAHLKKVLHDQGVNFFSEQSFSNLKEFVEPISTFWYPKILRCLNKKNLPANLSTPPSASHFSVDDLWKDLKPYQGPHGKVILVEVEKDEHLAPEVFQKYEQLAYKVNKHVTSIRFTSQATYHHGDPFFLYPSARRQFMESVFKK